MVLTPFYMTWKDGGIGKRYRRIHGQWSQNVGHYFGKKCYKIERRKWNIFFGVTLPTRSRIHTWSSGNMTNALIAMVFELF